jgi:hypothetical protein
MRNKLSFANMAFLMLLVGKIGHIGTLGGIPWPIVFIPLLLDVLLDYAITVGLYDYPVAWVQMKIKLWQIKRIANREKTNKNG